MDTKLETFKKGVVETIFPFAREGRLRRENLKHEAAENTSSANGSARRDIGFMAFPTINDLKSGIQALGEAFHGHDKAATPVVPKRDGPSM